MNFWALLKAFGPSFHVLLVSRCGVEELLHGALVRSFTRLCSPYIIEKIPKRPWLVMS